MIAAAAFLLGLGLLTAGVALVYPPAAFVVAGLALMAGAWAYVRSGRVTA